MKKLVLLSFILVLTSCGETEKVYTAKEFTYDEALLKSTLQKCKEDPAKNQNKPNCINASSAHERLFICEQFNKGPKVKECLDRYWAKQ